MALIVIMILGSVACVRTEDQRTQDDRPLAEVDGLRWRPMAHKDKTMLMLGAMVGSTAEQILSKRDVAHHGATGDLVQGLDAFYDVSANVPIPLYAALAYTFKKIGR